MSIKYYELICEDHSGEAPEAPCLSFIPQRVRIDIISGAYDAQIVVPALIDIPKLSNLGLLHIEFYNSEGNTVDPVDGDFQSSKNFKAYKYLEVTKNYFTSTFLIPQEAHYIIVRLMRWAKKSIDIPLLGHIGISFHNIDSVELAPQHEPVGTSSPASVFLIDKMFSDLKDQIQHSYDGNFLELPQLEKQIATLFAQYIEIGGTRRSSKNMWNLSEDFVQFGLKFAKRTQNEALRRSVLTVLQSRGQLNEVITELRLGEQKALSGRRVLGLEKLADISVPENKKRFFKRAKFNKRKLPLDGKAKGLYILHNSWPYHSGGYGTRAHGIIKGLSKTQAPAVAMARLGYPNDRLRNSSIEKSTVVDGITYKFLPDAEMNLNRLRHDEYIHKFADILEAQIIAHEAQYIMAASFFTSGLPAIIAARKQNIPSIYEMRGMEWLTKASEIPQWEHSAECEVLKNAEIRCAKEADLVFAITNSLKSWLVENGVLEEKIHILSNSIDMLRFPAKIRKSKKFKTDNGIGANDFVFGYIGSHVFYEGIDDLVAAFDAFRARSNISAKLLIVGSGAYTAELKKCIHKAEYKEDIVMVGRVAPEDVNRYYSLIDVCVIPRKSSQVCEMISPIKPLEIFLLSIPVIASDVAALAEIVEDDVRGLLFKAGDIYDLCDKMMMLSENPEVGIRLAKKARKWVEEERNWDTVTANAAAIILSEFS